MKGLGPKLRSIGYWLIAPFVGATLLSWMYPPLGLLIALPLAAFGIFFGMLALTAHRPREAFLGSLTPFGFAVLGTVTGTLLNQQ